MNRASATRCESTFHLEQQIVQEIFAQQIVFDKIIGLEDQISVLGGPSGNGRGNRQIHGLEFLAGLVPRCRIR
jgi:hypothetical protein